MVGSLSFKKNVQFLKIVQAKQGEEMYLENLIIKVVRHNNIQSRCSSQLKEYFFICHTKRSFKSLFPIILRAYFVKNHVFAQLLGFTIFFLRDIKYS